MAAIAAASSMGTNASLRRLASRTASQVWATRDARLVGTTKSTASTDLSRMLAMIDGRRQRQCLGVPRHAIVPTQATKQRIIGSGRADQDIRPIGAEGSAECGHQLR